MHCTSCYTRPLGEVAFKLLTYLIIIKYIVMNVIYLKESSRLMSYLKIRVNKGFHNFFVT